MTKASDNAFPSLLITEGTEPSAPAAGKQRLYIDSTTHVLMLTNSSGVESAVGGGAIAAWTAYTPSWTASTTNPTLGSSTIAGRYLLIGTKTGLVRISVSITTGGAWNAGSGEYKFSLPAGWTALTGLSSWGYGHVLDSGTAHYAMNGQIQSAGTVIHPMFVADASGSRILANATPVTWATGDSIDIQAIVELA